MAWSFVINNVLACSVVILLIVGGTTACSTTTPLFTPPVQPTPTSLSKDTAVLTASSSDQSGPNSDVLVALIGFTAGSVASLLGILSKYLLDYRIERRKLELNERQGISAVLGTSQSNLLRVTRDLFRWLSSFFDNPEQARQWLQPGPTPETDSDSLQEFCYLLFQFMTWGRITQDAINSLPTAVMNERTDLQRAYVFVDLALDFLAYRGLFEKVKSYDSEKNMRVSMKQIKMITEAGIRIWKDENQNIPRIAFNKLYFSVESPLSALREFLIVVHGNQDISARFIMARLAALRAVSAGFLRQYSWTIDMPRKIRIVLQLERHLQHAFPAGTSKPPVMERILQNMSMLMKRYRCKLFWVPRHWIRRLAGWVLRT